MRASKLSSKRGRYGKSKVKCFSIMEKSSWYPSKQLCAFTGIAYPSLGSALPRWVRYGYVERRPIEYGGSFEYRLLPKALSWLRIAISKLPNYKLFMGQLDIWQSQLTDDDINGLLSLRHLDFIDTLNRMIKEFQNNSKKVDNTIH